MQKLWQMEAKSQNNDIIMKDKKLNVSDIIYFINLTKSMSFMFLNDM